jgi:hypothetical protein
MVIKRVVLGCSVAMLLLVPSSVLGQQDTTLPEVSSVSPADGAIDVPINVGGIQVNFSEPMDVSTTFGSNVFYTDSLGAGASAMNRGHERCR